MRTDDSFMKITVAEDASKLWSDERGIVVMDIMGFPFDQNSLNR